MITAKKKNDEPTTSVDKHKVWLIAGISVAILAIAILILFPMFTGETGVAGKAITQPDNLILHYSFDDGTATDLSGKENDGTVDGATWIAEEKEGNILVDGDMEDTGASNLIWEEKNDVVASKQTTNPQEGVQVLRIASNGKQLPYVRQQLLIKDTYYRMTGYVRSDGTVTSAKIYVGNLNSPTATITGLTEEWTYFDYSDYSVDGYIGLLSNTALTNGEYVEFDDVKVTEIENGYFKFDGENDNIELTHIEDYEDGGTFSAWIYSDDYDDGNFKTVYSATHDTNSMVSVIVASTGVIYTNFFNDGNSYPKSSTDDLVDGTWNHVLITKDSGVTNFDLYLNGKLQTGTTLSAINTKTGSFIGARTADPLDYFNGLIDNVKIWNSVLSEKEICTEAGKSWENGACVADLVCVPDCDGKSCGDDGCGGSCGDCEGKICVKNKCVSPKLISYYSFVENTANDQQYANKNGVVNGATWIPNQMDEIEMNLADGDMDASDTSAWGKGQATLSKVLALPKDGNALSIKRDGLDGSFYAWQSVFESGKDHHITGYARGDGSSAPKVMKSGKTLWQGTSSTGWQEFDIYFTSHPTDDRIFLYGNNGEIGDTVQFDDITITEVGGGYFEFDGVDDNIDFGVIDYSDYSQMTVSAWFNKKNTKTEIIFANHKGGSYSFQLGTVGNKARFHFRNAAPDGDYFGVVSDNIYNPNELNHVVGVYDGNNVKIYLNGVETIGSEATGDVYGGGDRSTLIGMGIDSEEDPQSPLHGIIDEVKLWKGALTYEQICEEAGKKWDPATISCMESSSPETDDDDNLETCSVDGITNYWKGEDNIDDVIGNFDGVSKNNPGFTEGLIGKGFNFIKAQKQYLELGPTSEIVPEGSFSLVFWFKTDLNHPLYGGNEGRLIVFKQNSISAISTYLEKDNIAYLYKTGSGHKWVKYEKNYYDNQWHQYVLTYDGDTKLFTLYFDGENLGSSEFKFEGSYTETPLLVGAYTNGERSFEGAIDEIAIFNRELTNNEIVKFYNNGLNNGLGYCDKSAVCDSDNLGLCLDQDSCTGATGYWYDDSTVIVKCYEQCPDGTSDDDNVCEPVVAIVLGDVKADGVIDVLDIIPIINHIIGEELLIGDALVAANICQDSNSIDVLDIIPIINYIITGSTGEVSCSI
jgi:hypothetical protein